MAITFQGTMVAGQMVLQPGERTVYKRNGIVERTSIFLSYGYPLNPPIPLFTNYPNALTGGFVADQVVIESLAGGFYRTTVLYVSIGGGPNGVGTSYITYEVKMVQLPIEQSPNFTKMAGSAAAPINLAGFDGNGKFLGFLPGSQYAGVVSYFQRQRTMTIRGSSTSAVVVRVDGAFLETQVTTYRGGGVVEYEMVYNQDMNPYGIPIPST